MSKKITIITGASRGIGKATAFQLAKEGHFTILLARNREEIEEIEFQIDELGGKSLAIPTDIGDEQEVKAAVAQVIRDFGHIDHVINNAGLGIFKPAEDILLGEWTTVMETNVKGTFLLTKAVIPHMKLAKKGHIIGVASDVSKRVFANGSLYCASKYAQDAFLSAVRKEVRQFGVKVSVIYPGLVDTHFHGRIEGAAHQSAYLNPSDIAAAVSYILNAPAHVVVDELMIHPISQEY
jgi:NADP-dependent 3-hydroxy acid dehydrogenase YdfG